LIHFQGVVAAEDILKLMDEMDIMDRMDGMDSSILSIESIMSIKRYSGGNKMSNLIGKHGGYRKLLSFQIAQLVYDITVRFCARYLNKFSRTNDQMIQAARSGVQNIAEGSQAAATSRKTELKLTQVARASLEELKLDYQDFLRQRKLEIWQNDDDRWKKLVSAKCLTADDVAAWIIKACQEQESERKICFPEYSANAAIVLITVACSLLNRQVERLANDFEKNGGFSEKLYNVRNDYRNKKKK